ncbi:hypothetical protein QH639_19150 [Lysinibacillus sp. 1 U-2021]|uniref:hypothetical protein n=1 Tax=Lysinibacillus sp. 1 U-2021 TaxID=3039426 RepID=UPI0024805A35|nr:hypothetical protein [Lysinibacillus sp. 1 U-2021]WGT37920.1 hypothetical protein QH639_19150 [Lysinibacillus sp. 1 U-2021]
MKLDIQDAKLSLLIEIDGKVHLIGMDKEKLDAVNFLIKKSISIVIPTNRTQQDLRNFLNYKNEFPI